MIIVDVKEKFVEFDFILFNLELSFVVVFFVSNLWFVCRYVGVSGGDC